MIYRVLWVVLLVFYFLSPIGASGAVDLRCSVYNPAAHPQVGRISSFKIKENKDQKLMISLNKVFSPMMEASAFPAEGALLENTEAGAVEGRWHAGYTWLKVFPTKRTNVFSGELGIDAEFVYSVRCIQAKKARKKSQPTS